MGLTTKNFAWENQFVLGLAPPIQTPDQPRSQRRNRKNANLCFHTCRGIAHGDDLAEVHSRVLGVSWSDLTQALLQPVHSHVEGESWYALSQACIPISSCSVIRKMMSFAQYVCSARRTIHVSPNPLNYTLTRAARRSRFLRIRATISHSDHF